MSDNNYDIIISILDTHQLALEKLTEILMNLQARVQLLEQDQDDLK